MICNEAKKLPQSDVRIIGVEPKIGVVFLPPKSSILIGFSLIFTIHFGVPLFLETPIYV